MPNLSIKDVPDAWAEALRRRAARNHRSLQGELMAILEQATRQEVPSSADFPAAGGLRRGTRTLEAIAQEQRAQFPRPVRGGPFAVDIIRADRDAR
ncbi:MAG: Arc family DNA-binding protein [Burkholderiales bacterium]|nr:Arc family DNA-binding protein [Burkholderiales bacterium]